MNFISESLLRLGSRCFFRRISTIAEHAFTTVLSSPTPNVRDLIVWTSYWNRHLYSVILFISVPLSLSIESNVFRRSNSAIRFRENRESCRSQSDDRAARILKTVLQISKLFTFHKFKKSSHFTQPTSIMLRKWTKSLNTMFDSRRIWFGSNSWIRIYTHMVFLFHTMWYFDG